MEFFSTIWEIKKVSLSADNFWERDVHYIIRDSEVKTFLSKMKDFLFQP